MGHGCVHGRELHETSLNQTETIPVSRSWKELGVSFQPCVFCESHIAFLTLLPRIFMIWEAMWSKNSHYCLFIKIQDMKMKVQSSQTLLPSSDLATGMIQVTKAVVVQFLALLGIVLSDPVLEWTERVNVGMLWNVARAAHHCAFFSVSKRWLEQCVTFLMCFSFSLTPLGYVVYRAFWVKLQL